MNPPEFYRYPAEELVTRSPTPVTILPEREALFSHFARAIADEIAANNLAGRPTRLILPIGPVDQFPLLAEICNRDNIAWRNVHSFNMDEYCDWQGRRVPVEHPLSFEGHIRRVLFSRLRPDLTIPEGQIHFPDPRALDRIGEEIDAVGGIDTCYGGIGVHGHVAFNEPPNSRWHKVSPDEFRASRTRLVQLAPETVVMNATRAVGGDFAALPPMAVTLGMAEIYAARRIRLYCQGGVWPDAPYCGLHYSAA